jgi:hypothetical protein
MNTRQTVCGIFAVLVLVSAGTGVFAQEKKAEDGEPQAPGMKKNTVSLDAMTMFKGFIASDSDADTFFFCTAVAYERMIVPHFTIGAELDLYPAKLLDEPYLYLGMAVAARYYPMSGNMDKFFIGTHLGFNVQAVDGETDSKRGGFFGLLIGLRAGYKLMLGKAFSVEPSMSYTYSKSGLFAGMTPINLGWQGGLRMGISF